MPEIPQFRKIVIEKIEDIALTLLLPLFFVYTGLRTEIGLLNTPYLWQVTAVLILFAIAGKFLGSAIAAKAVGETLYDGLKDTLTLANGEKLAKAMVSGIRNVERAFGDGVKRPSASELKNKPIARKSLVAIRPIRAGETFSAENMAVKRPGTGLSPMRWDEVIGRAAIKDFAVDELITL